MFGPWEQHKISDWVLARPGCACWGMPKAGPRGSPRSCCRSLTDLLCTISICWWDLSEWSVRPLKHFAHALTLFSRSNPPSLTSRPAKWVGCVRAYIPAGQGRPARITRSPAVRSYSSYWITNICSMNLTDKLRDTNRFPALCVDLRQLSILREAYGASGTLDTALVGKWHLMDLWAIDLQW